MRITGGAWGGHRLKAPSGQNTRPTSDANREALFNILQHSFAHPMKNVVDLYAGSGALGFEALSRGAEQVLFFEKDPQALKCIRQNAEFLKLNAEHFRTITSPRPEEWSRLLEDQAQLWGVVDTVFCDPPYSRGLVVRALSTILQSKALSPEALVYVELARNEETPHFEEWECVKRRDRGASAQCFYRRLANTA